IDARRIERREIECHRLSNPPGEARVVGEIVVGERVDKRCQSRRFDQRDDGGKSVFGEMNLELRYWMRPDLAIAKLADVEELRDFPGILHDAEATIERLGH